jgi:hypothetical protein
MQLRDLGPSPMKQVRWRHGLACAEGRVRRRRMRVRRSLPHHYSGNLWRPACQVGFLISSLFYFLNRSLYRHF